MACSPGELFFHTIASESEKYTASIVFVHGLWCTPALWHGFMGYLAHRGWACHAVDLRSGTAAADAVTTDVEARLRRFIAARGAPPVLIGHDTGALLAIACRDVARAVVGLAPMLPESLPVVGNNWVARILRRRKDESEAVPPPVGLQAQDRFGPKLPGDTIHESSRFLRELRALHLRPKSNGPPTVLVGGGRDTISPASRVDRWAQEIGAETYVVDAGHPMAWGPGWQKRVDEVHRWLVHRLGESLLIPPDEEELPT
ncbi:MAG: alpha/beta hydrolase [Deltaproteobacteria bacterium]|nr:alpha/beta hydrolase [Deltaproteobacteria bacterium]